MNKQIQKLKNLAAVWCDQHIPDQFSEETNGYGSGWEDKFAELIIQECVDACYNHPDIERFGIYPVRVVMVTNACAVNIKQHFGVEE